MSMCGVLADTVMVLKAGSSLDLPFQYPVESVLSVQWSFNKSIFAECSTDKEYTFLESQFNGRLKKEYNRIGVTIEDLQPLDSGTFLVAAVSIIPRHQTHIFKVLVQSSITAVQIEKTWLMSTNSCDIHVKCAALGAESVSYLWSGYKTASGAHLQFSLSPAEGAVTLNCTAANNVSSSSATKTLSCTETQTEAPLSVLKLVSSLVAASPYLLVTIILGVKYYKARGHHDSQHAVTVSEE
ncbi:uncharacterized protein LOC131356845 [Hemibagrus wyckioides]|nr:uncharacterized protein LOC131356845 [Hemibagrus wyckioides]